ncbi:MAG: patatin-like phospholipase family protein [Gemmatimonadota bacterium]|nr:patatin-like phospholipase family protein [Gemmatimonadota bacterium]
MNARHLARALVSAWALTASALTGGCAHYTRNVALPDSIPSDFQRYRLRDERRAHSQNDSILVLVSASGGGTRAAAVVYGVLQEMAHTPLGASTTLADEIDVISSVSGGSFPAAYFGLFGRTKLDEFYSKFLMWDAQKSLILSLVYPGLFKLPSKTYSRIDLAERLWRSHLFGDHTIGDFQNGVHPFIIMNGTDFSSGGQFSFVSEFFEPLCSDVRKMPIARAVATSSAFPALLNPTSFRNFGGHCNYALPVWVSELVGPAGNVDAGHNPSSSESREKARAAAEVVSLQRASIRPYVHVMDGGIADNLGLRPLIRAVTQSDHGESLLPDMNSGRIKKVLWVVINARTANSNPHDHLENPPSAIQVLDASAGRPMNRLTDESLEALGDRIVNRRTALAQICKRGENTSRSKSENVREYIVYVSFDRLMDARERSYFFEMPTTFGLPRKTVDDLVAFGRKAFRSSPELSWFLNDEDSGEGRCTYATRDWLIPWRAGPDVP